MLNEVNARRINDELNVFEGIHKSPIFLGVLLVTAGLQVRVVAVCLVRQAVVQVEGAATMAATRLCWMVVACC
jgi:hypothetical protein